MFNNDKADKLEFMQKYFLNSFWISFIILIVSSLLCILMHDYQLTMVQKYFHADAKDLGLALVVVFGVWKVLIVQFTLIPALAVMCIRKCCNGKCGCKK